MDHTPRVREGDRVSVGQFLMQIDPRTLRTRVESGEAALQANQAALEQARQAVETAKVQLTVAQQNLTRQQELWKQQLTPRESLERAVPRSLDASALRKRLGELYRESRDFTALAELLGEEARRTVDASEKLGYLREAATIHVQQRKDPAAAVPLLELAIATPGSVEEALERVGHVPIPPYLGRDDDGDDIERYQTVYARRTASVAAPTAGLHLDEQAFSRLRARGVTLGRLELEVGIGTFRPVTALDFDQHPMHEERFSLDDELVTQIRASERHRGLPVVLVSSLAGEDDRKRGLRAGADAYLDKGEFRQELLLETLERLL